MAALDIRPITGALGAEVLGPDLSKPLGQGEREAIAKALADHLVVVFRDQNLEPAELEAFALQFGTLGENPYLSPLETHPGIVAVVREADEKGALFGGSWHSDWSFQTSPPSYTILYAKEVPPYGGDTVFTNQYLAYETLSAGMRRLIEDLKGVHSARRSYAPGGTFGQADPGRSMDIRGGEEALATELHPLVRTHPETGRKALFVNEVYTIGIEDMTEAESAPILDYLFTHARQVSFTCRVRWQAGSLTIWDNRCTQHHAIDDYGGRRREMHRITLAGERPV